METIHGKLVIRAHFENPSPLHKGVNPVIYTKQYVTREEAKEEFLAFESINRRNCRGELMAQWIPYPESL